MTGPRPGAPISDAGLSGLKGGPFDFKAGPWDFKGRFPEFQLARNQRFSLRKPFEKLVPLNPARGWSRGPLGPPIVGLIRDPL